MRSDPLTCTETELLFLFVIFLNVPIVVKLYYYTESSIFDPKLNVFKLCAWLNTLYEGYLHTGQETKNRLVEGQLSSTDT